MPLPHSFPESFILQLAELQRQLGYHFIRQEHLIESLVHSSYFHEHRDRISVHNERLEFLGDSVLGLLVVEYLFGYEEKRDEAVLSKIKAFIVSEAVLAECARELGLGAYIIFGRGESMSGGPEKPSILASGLEALIGAVFLDGGLDQTRVLVRALLAGRMDNALRTGKFQDYKTELQERSQALYGLLPDYKIVKEQGAEHKRIFTVSVSIGDTEMGVGQGKRKKEAETLAAKKALERLG